MTIKIILTVFFSFWVLNTSAQVEYSLYANIIYRFTKYVDWPDYKKSGVFIIGVIGDSPIYDELATLIKFKHVGNQQIVLKHFPSNAKSYNCHMLIVPEDESGSLKKISVITSNQPILLISENIGLIHKGACINILIVSDHLKLEFNKRNIESRNLNIASELLDLGSVTN